jgi:hypothetical protein
VAGSNTAAPRIKLGEAGRNRSPEKQMPRRDMVILSAAKIINRFHPRGKSAEQENQLKSGVTLRPITGDDALLAVRLLGFILIETGFAIP